jgi:hypothetical protein
MQEGCTNKYNVNHLTNLGVSSQTLRNFKKIDEDFRVALSKNLKFCPSADCGTVIKKPCCCKNKAVCTAC